MHESVKQTLKRKPRQEIDIAVNQAYKDVLFLRWNQIKVEMEMPHPQDPEEAAIDAAKRHHVLSWEALEEGDELSQRVLESFVAEGGTPLPDGAYLMRGGTKLKPR